MIYIYLPLHQFENEIERKRRRNNSKFGYLSEYMRKYIVQRNRTVSIVNPEKYNSYAQNIDSSRELSKIAQNNEYSTRSFTYKYRVNPLSIIYF